VNQQHLNELYRICVEGEATPHLKVNALFFNIGIPTDKIDKAMRTQLEREAEDHRLAEHERQRMSHKR
jgi:hypothetical protein